MMRVLATVTVALVVASLGLAACGTTPPSTGAVDMVIAGSTDDAGSGAQDMTPRGSAEDMAKSRLDGAASVTCGQGFTCNNSCGADQACGQACLDKINTAKGPALFMALQKCFSLAAVGPCASKCATAGQDCGLCLYTTCSADVVACNLDM